MNKLLLGTAAILTLGIAATGHAKQAIDKPGTSYIKVGYGDKAKDYKKDKKDIVDTAAGNEDFSTLVAAVQAAELVNALKGDGPFTVFAPTNAAFEALPEGAVEDLLKPENKEKLQGILKYHVVAGKIKAEDIVNGVTEVETLQGDKIKVTKTAAGVIVAKPAMAPVAHPTS